MKGFIAPGTEKTVEWWNEMFQHANSTISELFIEKLFYNAEDVVLHLLIPTQFGMFLNKKRNDAIYRSIKKYASKFSFRETIYTVMLVQESIMLSCCFCNVICKKDQSKPYQVCIRFISGFFGTKLELNHTILFGILCRKCQTTPWHALYNIDNSMYESLTEKIYSLSLSKEIDPSKIIGPEFVKRFSMLNWFVPDILLPYENNICFHCGKHDKILELCEKCQSVYFCVNEAGSGDQRFGYEKKTCKELSLLYHDRWLCNELEAGYLFRVLESKYVTPNGTLTSAIDATK